MLGTFCSSICLLIYLCVYILVSKIPYSQLGSYLYFICYTVKLFSVVLGNSFRGRFKYSLVVHVYGIIPEGAITDNCYYRPIATRFHLYLKLTFLTNKILCSEDAD